MKGQRVEFPSNGHTCQGYFAAPPVGTGPAVVVIQEWWGLVPHIEDVVDRFAADGFVAIAPDLYHGKTTKSPDDADEAADGARRRTRAQRDRRRRRFRPAAAPNARPRSSAWSVSAWAARSRSTKRRVNPKVGAAVSFYGGFKKVPLDWPNLNAPLLLIFGENDMGVPASQGIELQKKLREMGKTVDAVVYTGADHAFFNDTRPEVYNEDAAADAWRRTIELFRQNL